MMTSLDKDVALEVNEPLIRESGDDGRNGINFAVLEPEAGKIGQACMIQTLEKVHEVRKSKVEGNPHSPAVLHMSAIRHDAARCQ